MILLLVKIGAMQKEKEGRETGKQWTSSGKYLGIHESFSQGHLSFNKWGPPVLSPKVDPTFQLIQLSQPDAKFGMMGVGKARQIRPP